MKSQHPPSKRPASSRPSTSQPIPSPWSLTPWKGTTSGQIHRLVITAIVEPRRLMNTYGNIIKPNQEDNGPTLPSRSPPASTTPTHRLQVAPCPRVSGGDTPSSKPPRTQVRHPAGVRLGDPAGSQYRRPERPVPSEVRVREGDHNQEE